MKALAAVALMAAALHAGAATNDVAAVDDGGGARHVDLAALVGIDAGGVAAVEHAVPVTPDSVQPDAVLPVETVPPAMWCDMVDVDAGSRAYWVLVSARVRARRGEDVSWLRTVFAATLAKWVADGED